MKTQIKSMLMASCLLVTACSTTSLERGGWVQPSPQQSQSMVVAVGGFGLQRGIESVDMFVGIRVNSIPKNAKYLRVLFPDSRSKKPSESRVIRLSGTKLYHARSSRMTGFKYLNSYPVQIQLSEDPQGQVIIEEFTQYVRFQFSPAMQAAVAGRR